MLVFTSRSLVKRSGYIISSLVLISISFSYVPPFGIDSDTHWEGKNSKSLEFSYSPYLLGLAFPAATFKYGISDQVTGAIGIENGNSEYTLLTISPSINWRAVSSFSNRLSVDLNLGFGVPIFELLIRPIYFYEFYTSIALRAGLRHSQKFNPFVFFKLTQPFYYIKQSGVVTSDVLSVISTGFGNEFGLSSKVFLSVSLVYFGFNQQYVTAMDDMILSFNPLEWGALSIRTSLKIKF